MEIPHEFSDPPPNWRLKPLSVTPVVQLPPVLSVRIELWMVTGPRLFLIPPPDPGPSRLVFPENVVRVRTEVLFQLTSAPPAYPELFAKVVFVMASDA